MLGSGKEIRMNSKRLISLLLAALISASVLTACNTDTPSEEINNDPPVIEDPITEEPPVVEPPVVEPPVVEPPVVEPPIEIEPPIEPEPPVEIEPPIEPEPPVEIEPPIEPEPVPPEDPVAPTEPIAPTEPEYPHYYPQKDPNDTPVDKEDQVEVEIPLITVTKPENYVYPSDEILYLRENLPRMDGSTSLILLETGIKAKVYGISFTEALARVQHTTTYGSFERLLNKEVDMIFSTPISKEQYAEAEKKNMDLELIPIASEAFVFIVNADNPVDTLTQQQIKDIYSGKITNWKEVGGEDVEIVAFQRNRNSGSQNYMVEFMGKTPLADAPTEHVPSAMNSLVDAIKGYDNSHNAIGYSVYAYAADMYGLGDSLKFIKVDGVAPTKETMADKSYPLVNYNFAIYDKNSATEATLRTAAWLQSYDGQTAISEAGYVPYGNVQREYLELSGTGAVKPSTYTEPTTEFRAKTSRLTDEGYWYEDRKFSVYEVTYNKNETIKTPWKISGLANKDLEAEINAKLSDLEAKMNEIAKDFPKYAALLNSLADHTFNKTSRIYQEYEYYGPYTDVEVTVKNGYMCIIAGVYFADGADRLYCYHAEGVYYDLINGKEITFTDLFYKDVDVDKAIYELLTEKPLGSYNQGFFINAVPFSEITRLTSTEHFAMSFDKIYFTHDNPIFCMGEIFEISLDSGYLCADEPNNMEGVFDGAVTVQEKFLGTVYDVVEYVDLGKIEGYDHYDFKIRVNFLPETGDKAQRNKKINDYVKTHLKNLYDLDKMYANYVAKGTQKEYIVDNISYAVWESTFELKEYEMGFVALEDSSYYFNNYGIFDGETGEVIDYTALLKDGWKDHITVVNSGELVSSSVRHTDEEKAYIEKNEIPPNAEFYAIGTRHLTRGAPIDGKSVLTLTFYCPDSTCHIMVHVDSDYVKTNLK